MSGNPTEDEEAMTALFALGVFGNDNGGGGGRGNTDEELPSISTLRTPGNSKVGKLTFDTYPDRSPNSGAGGSSTPLTPIGRALAKAAKSAGGLLKRVTSGNLMKDIRTRLQGLRDSLSVKSRKKFNDKVQQSSIKQLQVLASKKQTLENAKEFIAESPSQGESKEDGRSPGLGKSPGFFTRMRQGARRMIGGTPKSKFERKLDSASGASDEEYFNKLFEKLLQEIIIKAQPEGWLIQELKSKQEEIINKFRNADPEQIESVQLYFQRKSIIGEILQDYIINRIRENKNLMANAIKTEVEQKEQQQARADKAEAKAKEVQKELAESQAMVESLNTRLKNAAPSETERVRITALETKKNTLEDENKKLKAEINSARRSLASIQTKVPNLQQQLSDKDAAMSAGAKENVALNEKKEELEAALRKSEERNDSLTVQLNERNAEKTEMEAKIQSLSAEIERLQALGKQEAEKLKKARQAVAQAVGTPTQAVGTPQSQGLFSLVTPEGGKPRMFTQRPGADKEAQPVISKGEKPKIEAQEARARAQRAQLGKQTPLQRAQAFGNKLLTKARTTARRSLQVDDTRDRIDDRSGEITLEKLRNDKSLLKNLNNTNVIKKLYKEIGGDTREGKDRTQMKKQIREKLLAEEKAKIGGESKNLYSALRF